MSAKAFGETVKNIRLSKKLSVRGLAKELNVSPTTVTGVEGGKVKDPRISILMKWIRFFNLNHQLALELFACQD